MGIDKFTWNSISLNKDVYNEIVEFLKQVQPNKGTSIKMELFIHKLILELIMYFQPYILDYSDFNSDGRIKPVTIRLTRPQALNLIQSISTNFSNEFTKNVINKRIYQQYIILKKIENLGLAT
ncbi:MAG: hypothetical protein ACW967_07555 [Candidatus Hodarchaeales archaeon]